MAQSEHGRIPIMEEFMAGEDIVLNTAASRSFGGSGLRVIGQGVAETDSGIVVLESDGLNGVGQLTTTNETEHSVGVTTGKVIKLGTMGTLIAEVRVRFADLDTKQFYFGLTDVNGDAAILEGENLLGSGTTITLTASDLCGFLLSTELTDDEDWHFIHNGGSATGVTDSTLLDANKDAVAGEFDILRLEVSNSGTAKWYINGVLKKTLIGAVSTTVLLAVMAMVEAKSAFIETVDLDYFAVDVNRDWAI